MEIGNNGGNLMWMKSSSLHLESTEATVVQKERTRNLRTWHIQFATGKVYTSVKAILMLRPDDAPF
jgi:hypothetical protein